MTSSLRTRLCALALLGAPFLAQAQALVYGPPITLETAKKVAAAAEAEARKNNLTMVIAVVDGGGMLVYLERMDGTQLASIEVAVAKARSSNNFKRPTKALEDAVAGGRNALLALPGVVPVEGGVLLVNEGKIIGAIGVSGGTSPQDGQVAAAGVAALSAAK
jgi:uncharacterized protein GlcG (DUF336 family)